MDQFDIVEATFQPRVLATLKPSSFRWIGWRGHWQAVWIIEQGVYAGEWAMQPIPEEGCAAPGFGWVPASDVAVHTVVSEV